MRADYREWLEHQKYDAGTINAQMHRVGRVEKFYGSLDDHFAKDRLVTLISSLKYTAEDKRRGKPNPSKIPFDGDAYSNLASYRNAVVLYQRFKDESPVLGAPVAFEAPEAMPFEPETRQRFGLERDLQAALRRAIDQLEEGLIITDEGIERSVDSGRIDITARDSSGATVVIELKAGLAGREAVAQVLSYMGDIAAEESAAATRGILVASDFDNKAKSAAKMAPTLSLRSYSIEFKFRSADGSESHGHKNYTEPDRSRG